MEEPFDATGFGFPDSLWYHMLLKDERFTAQVVRRYRQLRKIILSDAYLLSYGDDTVAWLGTRWTGIFRSGGIPSRTSTACWSRLDAIRAATGEAVDQVKDFFLRRGAWLDENIELLYQYCHPSAASSISTSACLTRCLSAASASTSPEGSERPCENF